MPLTPRFQLEYPSDEQDPWYGPFEAFCLNIDQNLYAQLERQNVLLVLGATPALNTTTDTFSWGATIELIAGSCGRIASIAAGGIGLLDGEILYADVPRPMTENIAVSMKKVTALGTDQRRQMIGVRRGTKVYMANGDVIVGAP